MKKCVLFLTFASLLACEQIDHNGPSAEVDPMSPVSSMEVARMLSHLPLEGAHLQEVHDAVSSSSANGYDEEYTMEDLFSVPGAGVGDRKTKAFSPRDYGNPLRDLISAYLGTSKAGGETLFSAKDLENSGLQLYWPWYDKWDGSAYPAITFDPGDGSSSNVGYKLSRNEDGSMHVEEIVVNETYAANNPVWVVNVNDDAAFTSVEMLRKAAGESGTIGGGIIRKKSGLATKAEDEDEGSGEEHLSTLVIKDFTMLRNYDSWLAGGSEFFIRCGSLEGFNAQTEADILRYNPSITDFMINVKRKDLGVKQTINAVLVDDWTEQLERVAFLITEDDGGDWDGWTTEGEVKIKSKTYGFKINIPYRSHDDIVWRGTLSYKYFQKYSNLAGRFGDVEVTFDLINQ